MLGNLDLLVDIDHDFASRIVIEFSGYTKHFDWYHEKMSDEERKKLVHFGSKKV